MPFSKLKVGDKFIKGFRVYTVYALDWSGPLYMVSCWEGLFPYRWFTEKDINYLNMWSRKLIFWSKYEKGI